MNTSKNRTIKTFQGFILESSNEALKAKEEALKAVSDVKDYKEIFNGGAKKAIENYLHYFVNDPMEIVLGKDDQNRECLEMWTMRGSSLRRDAKNAVKELGLDKWFSPKVEFEDCDNDHVYRFAVIDAK